MAMANEVTPESELCSIECFQNYTAPEVFIQGLAGLVDQQDVESMIRAQKRMLQRFEKTNEMLTNCNTLSVSRLKSAGAEFKKHTQLLTEIKKDLETIFKRIRILRGKLEKEYPEAYHAAVNQNLKEEDEEEKVDISAHNPEEGHSSKVFMKSERGSFDSKPPNSSSGESCNDNTINDSSPCTSDTG
ncbi:unnamed protein product [Bemisia tabaci]|uniref:KxDL domain-containing protein n=1 Tax=Bemisia tabaci TaxID=7038 RepID=A0A9P0F141_BEMTA|nr:unnamed protein product [Bemisia tabaci]